MCFAERNGDSERASLAEHTACAHSSAVEFDEFLHQRQANARSFMRPPPAVLDAMEALEHARQFFASENLNCDASLERHEWWPAPVKLCCIRGCLAKTRRRRAIPFLPSSACFGSTHSNKA